MFTRVMEESMLGFSSCCGIAYCGIMPARLPFVPYCWPLGRKEVDPHVIQCTNVLLHTTRSSYSLRDLKIYIGTYIKWI